MCNVLHYERQNKLHLPNKTLEIIKVWIQSSLKRPSLGGQKHTLLQIILICHQLKVEIHFILNDIVDSCLQRKHTKNKVVSFIDFNSMMFSSYIQSCCSSKTSKPIKKIE